MPHYGRRLTSEQKNKIKQLAGEGYTQRDIVTEVGCSVGAVAYHSKGTNAGRKYRKRDDARDRRLVAAYESAEKGTRDQIAYRFGLKDAKVLEATYFRIRARQKREVL